MEITPIPTPPGFGTALEGAFAASINGLNSCSGGTVVMFVLLVLAVGLIAYLVVRNQKTVSMVLNALLKREDEP